MKAVIAMTRAKLRRRSKGQLLEMSGIPVNRPYIYEKPFFKEAAPVLQGTSFPLKKKSFKSGRVKLGKESRGFGVPRRGSDTRNISYPAGNK